MRPPDIVGLIERRILVNYRVDPAILQRKLPSPFRVKRVAGFGIAGVCLIRLRRERVSWMPSWLGFGSENAAHRIAVEWDACDGVREGVFVPRRDTSSTINRLVGGRFFPGRYRPARFSVREPGDSFTVELLSADGATRVGIDCEPSDRLPPSSVFGSLREASDFFERGSLGFSATDRPDRFECLELRSHAWQVKPLAATRVESSWFADADAFPDGSAEFDCALLMQDIPHRWIAHDDLVIGP